MSKFLLVAFLDCFKERNNSANSDILARKRPLIPREISHDSQKNNLVPRAFLLKNGRGGKKVLVSDGHLSLHSPLIGLKSWVK